MAPESGLDGSRISDTVGAAPPCNRSTMTSLFQLQYVVKMPRHYLHPVGDTLQSLGSEEESVFCLIFSVTVIDTGDIIDIISDADAGDADHWVTVYTLLISSRDHLQQNIAKII